MVLKNIINKSIYGTMGYLSSIDNLELLESYILYNLPVLKEFKGVVVATNYGAPLQYENEQLWRKYFPNCVILDSEVNRGHNHGYTDLENLLFDWCKENKQEWLCKSANDIIFTSHILDKEIVEADYYYLNGIGYGGMVKYNFDIDRMILEDFYPQGTFYFLNTSKVDFISDKEYLDDTYKYIQSLDNYNGRIWEYIDGWSGEKFLHDCTVRNSLLKHHIIPLDKYRILLQVIKDNKIHDCSHKNIMIDGICHLQYPNQEVLHI